MRIPSQRVYGAMRKWFELRNPLLGVDRAMLDSREDLVALAEEVQPDRLSKLLYRQFGYIFKVNGFINPTLRYETI